MASVQHSRAFWLEVEILMYRLFQGFRFFFVRCRMGGSKTPCTWAGTYTSNDNYQVEFEASGYGWYMKQTRWEPEESEIACDKVKIISVNGGNIELTDELKERLEGEIMDACEGGEFEERWPE